MTAQEFENACLLITDTIQKTRHEKVNLDIQILTLTNKEKELLMSTEEKKKGT